MKNLIGISTLFITLFACSSPKNTPQAENDRMEFTITHIKNEKDGQTVSMTDDRGGRFITVISIPNGNYIDLAVGDNISLVAEAIMESDPAQVIAKDIQVMGKKTSSNNNSIQTTITTNKTTYAVGESIEITLTIENHSKDAFTFLDWGTPIEGRLTGNCLDVNHEGQKIPYTGIMVKRKAPEKSDYTKLDSGEKIKGSVNLLQGYKISKAGTYRIQFKARHPKLPASNILDIAIK